MNLSWEQSLFVDADLKFAICVFIASSLLEHQSTGGAGESWANDLPYTVIIDARPASDPNPKSTVVLAGSNQGRAEATNRPRRRSRKNLPARMVVRNGCFLLGMGIRWFKWVLVEMFHGQLHFFEKLICHLSGEPMANEYPLDDKVFAVRRHGISRDKPSALAQSIGKIVKSETR